MNNSLDRLIAGIIATLRNDVIPNVTEPYARGQAIGVVDVLGNIAGRIEWARAPLLAAVETRTAAIRAARALVPAAPGPGQDAPYASLSAADLLAERNRLDGEIADLLVWASQHPEHTGAREAAAVLRQAVRDDLTREMKMTKKPLFAEIARGREHAES
ncbi:hypothetical protein [Rhodoligotrophos defluvii]|uniref:hypothetical protein n=1 Tax=Rhodoligotrophos defluvii TaxID=2561934 RepID=UPI0010C941FC|nr:hypothetical protein [Rhodoligotrophos defluvii]